MKVVFTDHARRRVRERGLTLQEVRSFIASPDSIEPSTKNLKRFLIKKLYYHRRLKKPHLLMAVCEQEGDTLVIITIIDTSQIKKYI